MQPYQELLQVSQDPLGLHHTTWAQVKHENKSNDNLLVLMGTQSDWGPDAFFDIPVKQIEINSLAPDTMLDC